MTRGVSEEQSVILRVLLSAYAHTSIAIKKASFAIQKEMPHLRSGAALFYLIHSLTSAPPMPPTIIRVVGKKPFQMIPMNNSDRRSFSYVRIILTHICRHFDKRQGWKEAAGRNFLLRNITKRAVSYG